MKTPMCSYFRYTLAAALFVILICPVPMTAQNRFSLTQTYCKDASAPCVLTYHNNNNRDGVNPNETILKARNFQPPVPRWMRTVDGLVEAQPLYIHGLSISNTPTNVVFVVTENNSV